MCYEHLKNDFATRVSPLVLPEQNTVREQFQHDRHLCLTILEAERLAALVSAEGCFLVHGWDPLTGSTCGPRRKRDILKGAGPVC